MEADKAAAELKAIRALMERPVRYSTQSGVSGIIAGAAALAGCAVDRFVSEHYYYDPHLAMVVNICVWAGVFVVAFSGVVFYTRQLERRHGMPFWSDAKKRILLTILPPFVAGVGLTLGIVYRWYYGIGPNMWGLIPAIWMLFYGVACWQVGEFSIPEIRIMGAAFILAGLLGGTFFQYDIPGLTVPWMGVHAGLDQGSAPYFMLAVTFGGFHIIYGIIVRIRHGG